VTTFLGFVGENFLHSDLRTPFIYRYFIPFDLFSFNPGNPLILKILVQKRFGKGA